MRKKANSKKKEQSLKYDQGKPDLSLLPLPFCEATARAKMFGEKKYSRGNYRNGFNTNRLIASTLRHLLAWNEGENNDPESGLSHLDHACACLAILVTNIADGTAIDGRVPSPKYRKKKSSTEKKTGTKKKLRGRKK